MPDQDPGIRLQALLLAVAGDDQQTWSWAGLVEIVLDTILRAKMRAVEPDLLDTIAGVTKLHTARVIANTALTPGGTCDLTIDVPTPDTSFTSFDLIYVMTGGGPGHATELLITYIYKSAFTLSQFDYAGATAIALVMLLISFSLLLAINALQGWTSRRLAA